ncbi:DNA topoisomerase I [Gimesia maris]|uniref:DNA topoisomerase I n=1 Tax=Gimesia maris TaxID=122 RepID=A0ABX5YHR5_9PLAN|nr:DNA topoisomerase I [Gimesia maris]QEG15252.1 hypothetical protein GmarT_10920 [Gimesia maris]QGQ31417.1 DNA topoisomerase I [Gimesia maris]
MLIPFDQIGIIVGGLIRILLKPLMRFFIGLIAIPIFHLMLNKVIRVQEIDDELEKDLEQWFRGSLLLLAATANMESALFAGWVPLSLQGTELSILTGLRILLAIGVIEAMPDQELFSIIHPGPPSLKLSREYGIWRELKEKWRLILKGIVCQHINRSSPVFAILSATTEGTVGWVCYGIAITQYLIIGLVTSRDRALDVLSEFDRQVTLRRRELIEEFDLDQEEVDEADRKRCEEIEQEETESEKKQADTSKASA